MRRSRTFRRTATGLAVATALAMMGMPVAHGAEEAKNDAPASNWLSDDVKFQVVDRIREEALKTHEAITVDGVRILYPGGWGLIRPSNTQPVLVARCEGKTEEDLKTIAADVKARILAAGVKDFEWEY